MCGIAGKILFSRGSIEVEHIKKMTDSIAHRGPDDEGFWLNENKNVGFGHRRLSIIDLSEKGKQPMQYQNLIITYNGELYNYVELKKELSQKGYNFETNTDTEVILAAYKFYGKDCLKYFDGMFAFMIYDERNQEFFGARDRFGEKPFYYYTDKSQFLFASEMKAIFSVGIPKQVSSKMIYNYLVYDVVENPQNKKETFYNNIFQLPASHYITINFSGDINIQQYWDIDLTERTNLSFNEAAEKFLNLFDDSVKKRLRSDVKVGSSFSGGLDSSSIIASIIAQQGNVNLNTFTARFKDLNFDEGKYVHLMEEKLSYTSNYCWPNENLLIDELDKVFFHQEEPFGSSSIIAQWEVMKLAKDKGVTVLLDGQGADETLAGYYKYFIPYLRQLYKTNKTLFKKELLTIENNLPMSNILPKSFYYDMRFPKTKRYLGDISRPYRVNKIAPDLSPDLQVEYKKEPLPFNNSSDLNQFLHFDTFSYGLGKLLRFSDRNAMAHSREVRLPYLSHKLVEFVFSLPPNYKIKEGWSKVILRESMKNRLPKEIAWRKDKKGFQAPNSWMKNDIVNLMVHESVENLKREKIINNPIKSNSWKYLMINKLITC